MNEIIKNLQNLRSDKERQKVILDGEIKKLNEEIIHQMHKETDALNRVLKNELPAIMTMIDKRYLKLVGLENVNDGREDTRASYIVRYVGEKRIARILAEDGEIGARYDDKYASVQFLSEIEDFRSDVAAFCNQYKYDEYQM
ncbi:MAG: hypothetical protein U0J29_02890 [Ruminococcus sp.]|nr:hypothetical protein [Ruminococcus sp.]